MTDWSPFIQPAGMLARAMFKRTPGPLGLGSTAAELSYPFVQDQNFPGVADTRHAHAEALRKTIRDNPQATGTSLDGLPSTADYLAKAAGFMRDPYGTNAAPQAAPSPPPQAPAAPAPAPSSGFPEGWIAPPMAPAVPLAPGASPVAAAFPQAKPAQLPWWADGRSFGPPPAPPAPAPVPAPTAHAAPVPMPQARPAAADLAPPSPDNTSFFMRNALMQKDPSSGDYIDPTGAAAVRGPDLIAKMMSYLHNKDLG